MKKLTLVLCVLVAMAFVGTVFAQTATPPQKQTPPAQPTKPAEKPQTPAQPAKPMPKEPVAKPAEAKKMTEKKMMMEKKMMGVVVSVDAVANTIVVKHAAKKAEFTFEATPTTKIMVAGKEAKLADIMKDNKVTVTYKWEGKKRVAIAIKCE